MQVSGTSISTSSNEIEHFLGIHVLMGIMKFPLYSMYWAAKTRYQKIADVMSNKLCKKLCKYIHLVHNTTKENLENKNDKLFKIRPILRKNQS